MRHRLNRARGIQKELTWVALNVGVSRPRGVAAPTPVAPITFPHALGRESASVLATITRAWTRGGERGGGGGGGKSVVFKAYNLTPGNTLFKVQGDGGGSDEADDDALNT